MCLSIVYVQYYRGIIFMCCFCSCGHRLNTGTSAQCHRLIEYTMYQFFILELILLVFIMWFCSVSVCTVVPVLCHCRSPGICCQPRSRRPWENLKVTGLSANLGTLSLRADEPEQHTEHFKNICLQLKQGG